MIVNDQQRFVFARVPRTASTSIAEALLEIPGSRRVKREGHYHHTQVDSVWKDYYVFAVVRWPYERVLSVYYRRRAGTNEPLCPVAQKESFAEYLRHFPELRRSHDCPQVDFLGRLPRVDATLRFEGLPGCLGELPFEIPTLKKVGKLLPPDWRADYDEGTAAMVYEQNRVDFDTYGYDKESWN